MSRFRRSRPRFAWAKARVPRNSGPAGARRVGSCSSSTGFRSKPPRKRSSWPPPSCRSKPASSSGSPSRGEAVMKQKQRLSDLKMMSKDQLEQEFLNLKKEQFNLRFQRATGQLENTARVRVVRRDIARIKSLSAEKRHEGAK